MSRGLSFHSEQVTCRSHTVEQVHFNSFTTFLGWSTKLCDVARNNLQVITYAPHCTGPKRDYNASIIDRSTGNSHLRILSGCHAMRALVPCARAHARCRCGAAAAWPQGGSRIRAQSCNSGRGGGGGMMANPEASAGWMAATSRCQ